MKTTSILRSVLSVSSLQLCRSQLIPELSLHLLTPKDSIWHQEHHGENQEPFWAIFWPGGQVLTRYLIDSKVTKRKRGKLMNYDA